MTILNIQTKLNPIVDKTLDIFCTILGMAFFSTLTIITFQFFVSHLI